MFLKKSEHRRISPYVTLTVGALAAIGMVRIIKCGKRSVRCMSDKVCSMFKKSVKECTDTEG